MSKLGLHIYYSQYLVDLSQCVVTFPCFSIMALLSIWCYAISFGTFHFFLQPSSFLERQLTDTCDISWTILSLCWLIGIFFSSIYSNVSTALLSKMCQINVKPEILWKVSNRRNRVTMDERSLTENLKSKVLGSIYSQYTSNFNFLLSVS